MPDLVLDNVSKTYPPGVVAVDQLSLGVSDGELLVLVGPSGCGKTTTLRLIAGLDDVDTGAIRLGGRDVTRLAPVERDVGLLFQRPALYPHRSVRDNLAFGAALRDGDSWWRRLLSRGARQRHRDIAGRVAEVARLLDLETALERLPGQLSGGQQQRVALGRALVRQASVLLLDEPFGHLDAGLRQSLRRELHLLQRRLRVTMVVVTHDPVEALTLADRLAVLERGRLVQTGTPDAVFQRPVNRFVAGFVGWPAMNFLDADLRTEGGTPVLATAAGTLPLPPEMAAAWAPWVGTPLTVGVRPEEVALGEGGWPMTVRLVESLGHSRLLTLAAGGCEITAWQRGGCHSGRDLDIIPAEKTVMVRVQLEKCRLFDRATGAALAVRATG